MSVDLNFMVGGEAGQGIQTIGFVLGKTMVRGNLHVFADQDYESRIRGGHNFFRVRVSDEAIRSQDEKVDVLIAMDAQTVQLHRNELKENGVIVTDGKAVRVDTNEAAFVDVPMEKIAEESAGNKIMANSVALGAALGLLGYDFNILADVLRWQFGKNSKEIQEDNVKAARAGYDYAAQRIPAHFKQSCKRLGQGRCMLMTGHEAVTIGAMAAGCKFFAGYPMTPTTPILELMMEKGREYGIAVIQPEDEIAAINMVVGAAYTGARAMTATSGSGFALMVEGLGLAGITETPTVVVLGQRAGPAIGLPTRTEQGELLLAIRAGTGEYPRAVLTPATVEDGFWAAVKAFNLAEKYQSLVVILTDTFFANSYTDVEKFDLGKVTIDRGALLSDEEAARSPDYERYALTDSGISPRALPMHGAALVVADSDEHDEAGHLTEDGPVRTRQVDKRMRKYDSMRQDIAAPRYSTAPNAAHSAEKGAGQNAEMTLIGWGSTYGPILEASQRLAKEGVATNVLHFSEVWPFPARAVGDVLKDARKTVVVESNYTGQLANLITEETGIKTTKQIGRWDGRPISAQYILNELKKEVA